MGLFIVFQGGKTMMIAQQYMLLGLNEKGDFPIMHQTDIQAGLVVASLLDLLDDHVIELQNNEIFVLCDLPKDLAPLSSLYIYLSKKIRLLEKLISDYVIADHTIMQNLIHDVGNQLVELGQAHQATGGLFGPKMVYQPVLLAQKEAFDELCNGFKKHEELSEILIYLMMKTKILPRYVSRDELSIWKRTLKELKKDPNHYAMNKMLCEADELIACMMAVLMSSSM